MPPYLRSPLLPMRRFRAAECVRDGAKKKKRGKVSRDGYKKKKKKKNNRAPLKSPTVIFTSRGRRATTVKRRNFRNSTSRQLCAMTRSQNLSRGRETERGGGDRGTTVVVLA